MVKKRVLVVGAGSAGISCVDQLCEKSNEFNVTLIDSINRCVGQVFSIGINETKSGSTWLNQGGSPIFHHTFRMFQR